MASRYPADASGNSRRAGLRAALGERLKENEPLARYTSARIGGPAEYLVAAQSADELAEAARMAWRLGIKPYVLGAGSNVLVSDAGVRGLVILNRARRTEFREREGGRAVWAESGASLGGLARLCAAQGLAGLEWAISIPGTLGGAVYGNAGAHGSSMAACLRMAEILQPDGSVTEWHADELNFDYRSSALKQQKAGQIVLAAELVLEAEPAEEVLARMDDLIAQRKRSQPPGASMGSMFKNPPGDYAGRLIEAAGLKGRRVGNVEISSRHANFFVNLGESRAADVLALIHLAHAAVKEMSGTDLELEVELLGEWSGQC